jgi:hypothetical protein
MATPWSVGEQRPCAASLLMKGASGLPMTARRMVLLDHHDDMRGTPGAAAASPATTAALRSAARTSRTSMFSAPFALKKPVVDRSPGLRRSDSGTDRAAMFHVKLFA